MTIIVKIMSNQNMSDGNNSKDFQMIPISEGSQFKFVRNLVTGQAHVIVGQDDYGPGIRYPVTGNVYVTDDKKTICTYAATYIRDGDDDITHPQLNACDIDVVPLSSPVWKFVNDIFGNINNLTDREFETLDTPFDVPFVSGPEFEFKAIQRYLWQNDFYVEFGCAGKTYSPGQTPGLMTSSSENIQVNSGYICRNIETKKRVSALFDGEETVLRTKPQPSGDWDGDVDGRFTQPNVSKDLLEGIAPTPHDNWYAGFMAQGGDLGLANELLRIFLKLDADPKLDIDTVILPAPYAILPRVLSLFNGELRYEPKYSVHFEYDVPGPDVLHLLTITVKRK